MNETEGSKEPIIIKTGMFYDKITGMDASKPVKKQRVEIVQVGLNPSNLRAQDPKTGDFVELGDVQIVDVLKANRRTVPDDLARRVHSYYTIRARRFKATYMPPRQRREK